jgi:hypothetical protein
VVSDPDPPSRRACDERFLDFTAMNSVLPPCL